MKALLGLSIIAAVLIPTTANAEIITMTTEGISRTTGSYGMAITHCEEVGNSTVYHCITTVTRIVEDSLVTSSQLSQMADVVRGNGGIVEVENKPEYYGEVY